MNNFEKQYYEDEKFWEGTLLDKANKERIKETISLIPEDVKSLVDLGCGNGVFLNELKLVKPHLKLLGIDRSETALKYLTTERKMGDINNIELPDNSFDCVTCLEVIEHLPFDIYEKSLDELARVTSKYLIVSVPNQENLEDHVNQCPQCKTVFNSDLHFRSFTSEKLQSIFERRGFITVNTKTLGDLYSFFGHELYEKLFYRDRHKIFNVSICPVCGYSPEKQNVSFNQIQQKKNIKRILSSLSYFPKLIWPKKEKHYWVMSLFVKKNMPFS